MDITPEVAPVRHLLGDPAKDLEGYRLLHLLVSIDGRGYRMGDLLVDRGIVRQGEDLFLSFLIDLDLLKLFFCNFDRVAFEVDVKYGALLPMADPLYRSKDSVHDDPVTRRNEPCQIVSCIDIKRLRLFPSPETFRRLLDPEFLRVHEFRALRHKVQFLEGASVSCTAIRLSELAVPLLPDRDMATRAPKKGFNDPGAYFRCLPEDPLHADEFVDMV